MRDKSSWGPTGYNTNLTSPVVEVLYYKADWLVDLEKFHSQISKTQDRKYHSDKVRALRELSPASPIKVEGCACQDTGMALPLILYSPAV